MYGGLTTADGQEDPVGSTCPISATSQGYEEGKGTPRSHFPHQQRALCLHNTLTPPHPDKRAPTPCRAVGQGSADLAPSSLLSGQSGEGYITIITILQSGTRRHREIQAPIQGHTACKRPSQCWPPHSPRLMGPLIISMMQMMTPRLGEATHQEVDMKLDSK